MQSKKLHISELPIREFLANPKGKGPALRPAIYGKPIGLWYATGLEWIDRMQKVKTWQVTGEGNNFPYTRPYYNLVNQGTMLPWNSSNESNTARGYKGSYHTHYVYDLTFDTALYSENPLEPSTTKILRLSPACLTQLYTDVFLPFREKTIRGIQSGIVADLQTLLSSMKTQYYTWKRDPQAIELYGRLLKYLFDTKQFTKIMHDRYLKGDGEIDLSSEKYTGILKNDLLSGKLPLEGRLYDMFLRTWGAFWREEIEPKWAGVDFPHELFTREYQAAHPEFGFIRYVEIPSGCFFTPLESKPNLLFVLTWSLPDHIESQLQKINAQLQTVYTPEDTKQILLTKTYIATPTKKGEIRFHNVKSLVKDA